MLLSIIIPVYNGEKYIRQCLDSIYVSNNANEKLIEVIAVNDGSADSSLTILREYEKEYSNLHIIDKNNEGVSATRNIGVDRSTGKYLMFVDIDDMLEANTLENMSNILLSNDSDLYLGNYIEVSEDNENKKIFSVADDVNDNIELMHRKILFGYAMNACWAKIYKKQIIEDNRLKFKTDIKMGEDLLFVAEYCSKISTVKSINEIIYRYRQLETGAVLTNRNKLDDANIKDLVRTLECKKEYALKIGITKDEFEDFTIELSSVISGIINLALKNSDSLNTKRCQVKKLLDNEMIFNVMKSVSRNKSVNMKRRFMTWMITHSFFRDLYIGIKVMAVRK